MYLNTIKPQKGAKTKAKRLGRGIGSGLGKTCGRGHKGQKARAGGYHKVGFEGGQMPMQRRLPKFGFVSRQAKFKAEIRLDQLHNVTDTIVNLDALKKANVIPNYIRSVKVISAGKIEKPITLSGIGVTSGARKSIESAGGKIQDLPVKSDAANTESSKAKAGTKRKPKIAKKVKSAEKAAAKKRPRVKVRHAKKLAAKGKKASK